MPTTPLINNADVIRMICITVVAMSVVRQNFDGLYLDNRSWLAGWLCKKVGCSELAADITQDTFIRLLTNKNNAGVYEGKPRALLTHIAKGIVIDHWRRKDVEQAYLAAISQVEEHAVSGPEHKHIVVETLMRLDKALCLLPELTRKIFLLAQLDGYKYKELAAQFDIAEITVKRHMKKAFIACLTLD
ncbi:sigma-70 family RNA polymerase sigma factor [Bowmanella denitrificans]